jgi:hypothetical protein
LEKKLSVIKNLKKLLSNFGNQKTEKKKLKKEKKRKKETLIAGTLRRHTLWKKHFVSDFNFLSN